MPIDNANSIGIGIVLVVLRSALWSVVGGLVGVFTVFLTFPFWEKNVL